MRDDTLRLGVAPDPSHADWTQQRIRTPDGVWLDGALLAGPAGTRSAIVLANGFTRSWRHEPTQRIARRLCVHGSVQMFDFRGHHRSGGVSTVGKAEVTDLQSVVTHLRAHGYRTITTVGFSMGASVVLRHAAEHGGVTAVVAVSGPGQWYYRGTRPMRLLHRGVEHPLGRLALRTAYGVRVTNRRWDPAPADPTQAAARLSSTPLLVVHGDSDDFFPVDHAERIHTAAGAHSELWIEPGFGHAERAISTELVERIGTWVAGVTSPASAPPS
ncbi:alpha/beta hydrolase [Lipingzhangella sp. LS1_29]|uniref:Alpha/beta hydrolase n=1 Tax=Lipingzhangella rawalii TaxID=2055835 RepID=A0ABU2HA66_9ACTN|nr:alpha/beta hydrolase [Lipingzhangella rawalii]MDS1272181.1 alpha/beta hydrolase [Lipingzhangella rawalii]